MNRKRSKPKLSFLPLLEKHGIYSEVPDSFVVTKEQDQDVLEADLKAHFVETPAKVEIDGMRYQSTVYVSGNPNEYAYVQITSSRVPTIHQRFFPTATKDFVEYKRQLLSRISTTEHFFPTQRRALKSEFIRPHLRILQPDKPTSNTDWDSLGSFSRLVLVGPPGIGKTTCLRRLLLESLEDAGKKDSEAPIPVYIALRTLAGSEPRGRSLEAAIAALGIDKLAHLEELAAAGQISLFLDGFDEIPLELRPDVSSAIRQMGATYPCMKIVISTRPVGYDWNFGDFTHVSLEPFSSDQMKEWTFQAIANSDSWRHFTNHLFSHDDMREVATVPLVLALSTAHYLNHSVSPFSSKTFLINKCIDLFIDEWDAYRSVRRCSYEWATPPKNRSVLSSLARELCRSNRDDFGPKDVLKWNITCPTGADPQQVLSTIAEQTGLLKPLADGSWSFNHRSIKQLLAAEYVVSSAADSRNEIHDFLVKTKQPDLWLNSCSLATDASSLVDRLLLSEEVEVMAKLSLLADAFALEIVVNPATREKCLEFFCDTVKRLLRRIAFVSAVGAPVERISRDPIWTLSVQSGHIPPRDDLFSVIRALHRMRASDVRHALSARLNAMLQEKWRCLSLLLLLDGNLQRHPADGAEVFTLEPETPDID